jgi:ABC-type antimicrobial peptide transport system permease subunit
LHAAVGDEITVDADTSRPLRLRIVASLADSVMQGEILIAESAFQMVFPDIAGYRMFLVSVDPATPERIDAVTRFLEERLDPIGFDAEETSRRLEAFHRVENTYLSTFQALGGLGLVLGCLGLVAVVLRNVLERRRELALLGAAGFTGADLQKLIAIEHLALVGVGLAVGIAAAALAVAPVVVARGGGAPWRALVWVLPVAAAGMLAAYGATRGLRKMPLVESLRSE